MRAVAAIGSAILDTTQRGGDCRAEMVDSSMLSTRRCCMRRCDMSHTTPPTSTSTFTSTSRGPCSRRIGKRLTESAPLLSNSHRMFVQIFQSAIFCSCIRQLNQARAFVFAQLSVLSQSKLQTTGGNPRQQARLRVRKDETRQDKTRIQRNS